MSHRTGYLTVLSADRQEIYGEFANADWTDESTDIGKNHIFSGTAGDGAFAKIQQLNEQGVCNVSYVFETEGKSFKGRAQLLAPEPSPLPGGAVVRLESTDNPF